MTTIKVVVMLVIVAMFGIIFAMSEIIREVKALRRELFK